MANTLDVIAIKWRSAPNVNEQFTLSAIASPGNLVEFNAGQLRKHAGAAKTAAPNFLLERSELGQEVTVAYASGDNAKLGKFSTGDEVNAIILASEVLVLGSPLESDGAGRLRLVVTDTATDDTQRNSTVAYSNETITPGVDTLVAVTVA